MTFKCFKFLFLIVALLSSPAAALTINISTEPISFGNRSSTEGSVSPDPGHIDITFDREEFETWLRIYTDNAETYNLHGLRDRNQDKEGFYGGLIATNTITRNNFSRIELFWHTEELPGDPAPPEDVHPWRYMRDRGDDIDWYDPEKEERNLEEKLTSDTRIHLRGFFGEENNKVDPGNYATTINLDFFSEKPQPPQEEYTHKSTATIGTGGGKIQLDNGSYVAIPSGALEEDTDITIEQLNPEHPDISVFGPPSSSSKKKPSAIYRLSPPQPQFKKPVEIRLVFGDYTYTKSYRIFRWDETFKEWDLIGGHLGESDGNIYVSANIQTFSIFSVYAVEDLRASDFRPKNKIITPHDSTMNTEAKFRGLGEQDTKIRIFDITGRLVRTLDNSSYIWDAKDENGNTVESGIYIYQFDAEIEGDTQLVSGTIAVAK